MRYPIAYVGPLLIVALVVGGFYLGGAGFFALPIAALLLFPFLDEIAGKSLWPSEHRNARLSALAARRYDQMLKLGAAASVGLLVWALWAVSTAELVWWQFAGLALSTGLMSGFVGVVVSHELLHRRSRIVFPMMALIGYVQFCIAHIRGHHVQVATPEDFATARRGESLYAFLPRWAWGGLRTAWHVERLRLERAGRSAFSTENRLLFWHGFTFFLLAAIWLALGPMSALFFAAQAVVAILSLAVIDYIEHYGLLRERLADGSYERVGSAHTWNSNHLLTNVSLFNLGRHTSHHQRATEPYHRLRADAEAPQFPYGHLTMMLIAIVPPLWFRVMDREHAAWRARKAVA